ncbi:MAG: hypothetical protein LLF83_06290 [Methanobacterium sp.]|nr:hypothetical protein [Methanobacterium sp.]
MADSKNKSITKTKVEHFKENNRLDKRNESDLYIKLDETHGFEFDDEVMIIKCSELPEIMDVKNIADLRKKIDELNENAKRVRELKRKLESAQESYNEEIKVIKIKTEMEINKLKEENEKLKKNNEHLNENIQKINNKINELNIILNIMK